MSNSKYRKTTIERKPPTNYKPKRETLISVLPLNVGDVPLLAVVDHCRLKDVEKKNHQRVVPAAPVFQYFRTVIFIILYNQNNQVFLGSFFWIYINSKISNL